MNQKATYEITITEKLGHLPLPDLKDAIWSRIEDQLDIDMPEDGGNGPDAPQSPDWTNLLRNIGPFAVVVAIVTIFLINKNRNKARPDTNRNSTPPTQVVTTPPPAASPGVQNKGRPPAVFPSGNPATTPVVSPSGDSVLQAPPIVQATPVLDTATRQDNTQLAQVPPVAKDSVAKKKRGVSGITDNDYRIVPVKKDSTKQ